MADSYAVLSNEEQEFFSSQGEKVPSQEPKVEAPEVAAEPEAPKVEAKQTKQSKKAAKAEPEAPKEEETVKTEPAEPEHEKQAPEQIAKNLQAALNEERERRKQAERTNEERIAKLQELILQKVNPPQPKVEEQIPDPEKDPVGALKVLLKQSHEYKQNQQATEQENQRALQEQRIMGDASRAEGEYLSTLPDFDANTRTSSTYNEASAFLINMRRAELNALGYQPMQIQQTIKQEAIGLAAQALQGGRNPAQIVMDLAKARGFAPKPKTAEAPKETEQQKIERIAKGQEAGFSIGSAAGAKAPNNSRLDAKNLANMSDEDFTAFMEKAKKSDLRGLMGD